MPDDFFLHKRLQFNWTWELHWEAKAAITVAQLHPSECKIDSDPRS